MTSTNYFQCCHTIHDAKKRFRELTKMHHPDAGGDVKIMQEVINQYDRFIPSQQAHSNRFRGYKPNFQEQTDSWNTKFHGKQYESDRHSFNFSSIPFDHPSLCRAKGAQS